MSARIVPGSLRARFALLVVLAMLPVLAAATLTHVYQRGRALDSFVTQARSTTHATAADLDRILSNSRQLLSLLDHLPQTRNSESSCAPLLRHLLDSHPFLDDLAVATADGRIACSARGTFAADTLTAWPGEVPATGLVILGSRPQTGTPQRELILAYRPRGGTDGPTYVAAFSLAWIGRLLDAAGLTTGTIGTVIDADGTVLFRSAEAANYVGQRMAPGDLDRIRHSDERWNDDTSGLDGTVRRYVAADWGRQSGRPLLLAIGFPTEQVLRPYNRVLLLELLFILGTALIALIVVERTARALVLEPIDSLVHTAERVGHGELTAHVEPRGSTEVRALAATFNQAIDTLRHNQALEERLQHSQRLHAVGQLAGGVAHEFNNMLTVIMGYADGLLREDPGREELAAIRDAAQRASRLTQQLLAFGRKQVLQPRRAGLNALVHNALAGMAPMLKPRIAVVEALSPDDPQVMVDRLQFEHVLLNVLLNARDAMPDGGTVAIRTSLTQLEPGDAEGAAAGRYGVLEVSDTGTGMDADTLSRALEPFFTTKPFGQSAGLGLSTAYGIVRQSGGHFLLASTPGHGTTVTVYLPAA